MKTLENYLSQLPSPEKVYLDDEDKKESYLNRMNCLNEIKEMPFELSEYSCFHDFVKEEKYLNAAVLLTTHAKS